MSAFITILDRLLEQSSTTESKEHVLEQASYAVDNVQQRLLTKFEEIVADVVGAIGQPEFNASTEVQEGSRNPMPSWVIGSKGADASKKVVRLCYWRRDGGISFLLMRIELDSRDRPTYYDLVLGGRRRTRTDSAKITAMRQADTSFIGWVKRLLSTKQA